MTPGCGEENYFTYCWVSNKEGLPCGSVVNNLPFLQGIQETWVRSLGDPKEDSLGKGMATHSNIFAWSIPWAEEAGRLQFVGSQRVRHNWSNLAHSYSSKENGHLMPQTPELLNGFQGQVFKDNVRDYHRVCDQFMSNCLIALLWGKWWWVRDFNHQTSGSNHSGLYMLVVSM